MQNNMPCRKQSFYLTTNILRSLEKVAIILAAAFGKHLDKSIQLRSVKDKQYLAEKQQAG
jgi:hypothetical protein